jgi:hypothetical protein
MILTALALTLCPPQGTSLWAIAYGTALPPLRGSTAYGVFGQAGIDYRGE